MTEFSLELASQLCSGDRAALARAITLVESERADHREQALQLVGELLSSSGKAQRVGITGAPGVGKSTFIEALGLRLIANGFSVAVLAVDPSSTRGGGSILGDKTRMERLSREGNAFIRPSPSSGVLGGVARATSESIILVEAAGFDVVLVETVGVGQSETRVADMVDFFIVLMQPAAGDELQGIKKGVLEVADLVAVNKQDIDPLVAAQAVSDYSNALRLVGSQVSDWSPPVLACSAINDQGLGEIWDQVELHAKTFAENGERERRRSAQRLRWMWATVEDRLLHAIRSSPEMTDLTASLEREVIEGSIVPSAAADEIVATFLGG